MVAITRPHVFRRLMATGLVPTSPRVLSKATLTELSHVLENAVVAHDLDGAVFTGFQRSANWLKALARYDRLIEPRARSVAVFAAGNLDSMGADDIVKVELGEDSPLTEEWFLIVLTREFCAALIGAEIESASGRDERDPTDDELDRRFDTIWSFDPDVVTVITRFVHDEVATFDPAAADQIRTALARFPPHASSDDLRDELLSDIVTALERSRMRQQQVAQIQRQAATDLRELDRAKNAFLSAVSHELRTPLTVVRGLAETLDRLGPDLPEGHRDELQRALLGQAERLAGLLDDLLDVDRMNRGALQLAIRQVDLVALIRRVVDEHSERKRVAFQAPPQVLLRADAVQLQRIVVNLLDNARKYAPDGPIDIVVQAHADDGLLLEVRDHGPGIPPAERTRVFEPFHRVDDGHPQPGTGIGLALVAEFARLHGGRAWTEPPTEGQGTRILIALPRLEDEADPTP
jgi:signal transduction histidine kinase